MNRVMVIGNIGAGKSTFARKLHSLTQIEIYHLDKLFFKTRKEYLPKEEWEELVSKIVQKDKWIIDGNYPNTLNIRAQRADTIFLLDPPIFICYLNIIKRSIGNFLFGRERIDSPLFRYDELSFDMLRRIWKFKSKRKKYYSDIFAMKKDIYHFKTRKEIMQFINNLN